MKYTVVIGASAGREIKRLDASMRKRAEKAIASLAGNPRPSGCRKMIGSISRWRVRVGDYRVVYDIEDAVITVHVVKIGHRKDIYR